LIRLTRLVSHGDGVRPLIRLTRLIPHGDGEILLFRSTRTDPYSNGTVPRTSQTRILTDRNPIRSGRVNKDYPIVHQYITGW
jgi:hypothetical protein